MRRMSNESQHSTGRMRNIFVGPHSTSRMNALTFKSIFRLALV